MPYIGQDIADVAVTVGQGVITATQIQDASITTADIGNDAVTPNKLDDDGTGFQMGSLGLGTAVSGSHKLTVGGTATFSGNITGTLATAAQTNITSVGTLSSLTVTGDANFDSNTLFVDASENRVGINTNSPSKALDIVTPSDAVAINLRTRASDDIYSFITFKDNDLSDSEFFAQIAGKRTGTDAGELQFYTSGDNLRATIDNGGQLILGGNGSDQTTKWHSGSAYVNAKLDVRQLAIAFSGTDKVTSNTSGNFTFNEDTTFANGVAINGASIGSHKLVVDNGTTSLNRGNTGGDILDVRGLNASQMKVTTSAFTVTPSATFSGSVQISHGTTPDFTLNDTGGTTNKRVFRISGGGDAIYFEGRNNDNTGAGAVGGDGSIMSMSLSDASTTLMRDFYAGANRTNAPWDLSGSTDYGSLFFQKGSASLGQTFGLATNVAVGGGYANWYSNIINASSTSHRHVQWMNDGTSAGTITWAASNQVAYNTSQSDKTLKKNFANWTENILDSFDKINPQLFHFKIQEDTEEKSKGFIAQEMIDKFPEAYPLVAYGEGDNQTQKYQFNPSGMVVYLMKAVQELSAKVTALEGN